MSEKEDREYVVEAMGLHAAKLLTSVKPYQIKALCEALAKSESLTAQSVAQEAARWREPMAKILQWATERTYWGRSMDNIEVEAAIALRNSPAPAPKEGEP